MYPLRSITFIAELLHPRIAPNVEVLQRVHHRAFAAGSDGVPVRYTNFQMVPNGGVLSNPPTRPGVVSSATFGPDRVRIQEQNTGIGRDEFQHRVASLAAIALEELPITEFVAQQFVVQSLVNPRASVAAEQFMKGSVLQMQDDRFTNFGRAPDLYGLRLRFPANPDDGSMFHVRVENYQQDPRSLFLENVGVFRVRIAADPTAALQECFDRTYDFLQGPLMELVEGLDGREQATGGE